MRCKKCCLLGHTKNKCRAVTEVCERCGKPGHGISTCTATRPFCINCGGDHPASDGKCPHYVMRKEMLQLQTKEKITFREAKSRVRILYATNNKQYIFNNSTPAIEPEINNNDIGEVPEINQTTDESVEPKGGPKTQINPTTTQREEEEPVKAGVIPAGAGAVPAKTGAAPPGAGVKPAEGWEEKRGRGRDKGSGRERQRGKSGTPRERSRSFQKPSSSGFKALAAYEDMDQQCDSNKRPRTPSPSNHAAKTSKIDVIATSSRSSSVNRKSQF